MPLIVVNLTLGSLAAAVVLTATIIVAAIAAVVLSTTRLSTGGLAAIRGGVALAIVWAAIVAVARGGLVGAGLARCTSCILRST
jgi:hypothetical protein